MGKHSRDDKPHPAFLWSSLYTPIYTAQSGKSGEPPDQTVSANRTPWPVHENPSTIHIGGKNKSSKNKFCRSSMYKAQLYQCNSSQCSAQVPVERLSDLTQSESVPVPSQRGWFLKIVLFPRLFPRWLPNVSMTCIFPAESLASARSLLCFPLPLHGHHGGDLSFDWRRCHPILGSHRQRDGPDARQ